MILIFLYVSVDTGFYQIFFGRNASLYGSDQLNLPSQLVLIVYIKKNHTNKKRGFELPDRTKTS